MDGVCAAAVSQSVEAVNQLLQTATTQAIDQSKKLLRMNAELAVGSELGKGGAVDVAA